MELKDFIKKHSELVYKLEYSTNQSLISLNEGLILGIVAIFLAVSITLLPTWVSYLPLSLLVIALIWIYARHHSLQNNQSYIIEKLSESLRHLTTFDPESVEPTAPTDNITAAITELSTNINSLLQLYEGLSTQIEKLQEKENLAEEKTDPERVITEINTLSNGLSTLRELYFNIYKILQTNKPVPEPKPVLSNDEIKMLLESFQKLEHAAHAFDEKAAKYVLDETEDTLGQVNLKFVDYDEDTKEYYYIEYANIDKIKYASKAIVATDPNNSTYIYGKVFLPRVTEQQEIANQ